MIEIKNYKISIKIIDSDSNGCEKFNGKIPSELL